MMSETLVPHWPLELVAVAVLVLRRPRPVLLLPPMRFMATASVAWASVEIEPSDIAPVAKRLTISAAGSTSSSGMGLGRLGA